MIKAAVATAIVCTMMLIGNAQAKDKDPPPPPSCGPITTWGCAISAIFGGSGKAELSVKPNRKSVIPITPPVRSR